MLKVKKIKVSGFRGILPERELLCTDGKGACSLVLFGPNSSGKTSFVDGIEWFLSRDNKIQWLRRENAEEAAYPHHKAQKGHSYVEIEFVDDDKSFAVRKTFDQDRVTKPTLSNEAQFKSLYNSFVIKPYFRYMEVVEFVLNYKGNDKYAALARWMGFENALQFQEKIALKILPHLEDAQKNLKQKISGLLESIKTATGVQDTGEKSLVSYCNSVFKKHNIQEKGTPIQIASLDELENSFDLLKKYQIETAAVKNLNLLGSLEIDLKTFKLNANTLTGVSSLQEKIQKFLSGGSKLEDIEVISLYNKAQDLIAHSGSEDVKCPVCGTAWKKDTLLAHIKTELSTLEALKEAKTLLEDEASDIKKSLRLEQALVAKIIQKYEEIKKVVPTVHSNFAEEYKKQIEAIEQPLDKTLFTEFLKVDSSSTNLDNSKEELQDAIAAVSETKDKTSFSKAEIELSDDIGKLKRVDELWNDKCEEEKKLNFYIQEVNKFKEISTAVEEQIRNGITNLFDGISHLIEKYFLILRQDKKIEKIKIDLNVTKKAAGRSAEIQLNYFDVEVKPAYKVLSESLLNSLGLSIYFACVKTFNKDCAFIILDDIINSLDAHHRGTLLDLLGSEFSDYQFVLFTHDNLWFDIIRTRFPHWIKKKVKLWEYETGPQIDFVYTTYQELTDALKDETQAKYVGQRFGEYLEGIMNELCENIEAKLKYRYYKQDPPAMNELFEGVIERLGNILGKSSNIKKDLEEAHQKDILIRNFCSHDRRNYASGISSPEIKSSVDNWFNTIEPKLRCQKCNRLVAYVKAKEQEHLQCPCGHLTLK